jgi:hypothetical protein
VASIRPAVSGNYSAYVEIRQQGKAQCVRTWSRLVLLPDRLYVALPIHQSTFATIFQECLALRVMASYCVFSGCRTSVWS